MDAMDEAAEQFKVFYLTFHHVQELSDRNTKCVNQKIGKTGWILLSLRLLGLQDKCVLEGGTSIAEMSSLGLIKVDLEFSSSIPGLFQTWNSNKPGFENLNSRSEPVFEKLNSRSELELSKKAIIN